MEEKTIVKTFQVDFACPKCINGYLRPTGKTFLTAPLKYEHICNNANCSYTETFTKTYPYIDYEF